MIAKSNGWDGRDTQNGVPAKIVAELMRAAHLLRIRMNSHFAEFGLNDVRYTVLSTICAAGEAGCSQVDLAERLEQSESNICTLVERMKSDGLLDRQQSNTDRRKRILLPTAKGREILSAINSCHDGRMSQLLQSVDVESRSELLDQLEVLNRDLASHNTQKLLTISQSPLKAG